MRFNQEQMKAVCHRTGPCQVLAGPGSGKTFTIVNRIRYLIEECNIRPEEILVVTFTRYAAAEMKTRLCALMNRTSVPVTAGTFHGIFYGILKWAYRISGQNILSEEEKYQILRMVVRSRDADEADEEDFLRELAEEIGRVKNGLIPIGEYEPDRCAPERFREIYRAYEEKRKELRKLDFDDMLTTCHELFISRPDVLRRWQQRFRYILVDEFQDINRVQYEVIRMLALPENNLFVVGDDDQAIYGFRGADPELMFRFRKDYPDAEQILLGKNYRSAGNIVRNSMKVIGHNEHRYNKELEAVRDNGACLHVQELKDPNEEAQYAADEIGRWMDRGIPAEQIAVLFRIHTDARPLAEELVRRKIPFWMRERLPNLYEHFIAQDLQAYIRLSAGQGSRSDFLRIMNRPKRYIGRDSLAGGEASFEAMRKFYCDKDWMLDRIDQFEWDVKMIARMAPYAAIQYIKKKIGYDDFLKDYAYTTGIARADLSEVLLEIEEASKPYRTAEEWTGHIRDYTEMLRMKEKEKNRQGEGIRLMTLHAAKGLEFQSVLMIGANEGRMPYQKAKTDAQIEEERRLFYVGMTRAGNELKICYVKTKNGKETDPSRFVCELLENTD